MSSTETAVTTTAKAESATKPVMFTFGEPESVVGGRAAIMEYAECMNNGRWYEPPVSFSELARTLRVGAHHESALRFKVNVLTSTFKPSQWLSAETFQAFALDYLVLGNGFLEKRSSRSRRFLELRHSLGKYTRRGTALDTYYFLEDFVKEHQFPRGAVFHLREPDLHQEVYGLPQYLGALQSAFLNEAATLFRRRYFANGSHAGFILYVTDAAQSQDDIDAMREQLIKSKGAGNFKNLFYYAPDGKADGIKLIPISEVAAKDDFINIKNSSRDDVLAAHRVPPQLMGMMPNNTGGFGDVEKAAKVFARNELVPLQVRMKHAINDWAGVPACDFEAYMLGEELTPARKPAAVA
ncbi:MULTISPECIES: phage portal protein [Comamonas]|uniref:phage portal protein n=1 Tax=Comamonas TaxID=283 RepID=UPI0006B8CE6C|nr:MULTISPECIES: phage portal protein [Comamonas]QOQ84354.1 phage portal protein [Comamonas thiooxydans]